MKRDKNVEEDFVNCLVACSGSYVYMALMCKMGIELKYTEYSDNKCYADAMKSSDVIKSTWEHAEKTLNAAYEILNKKTKKNKPGNKKNILRILCV